MHKPDPLTLLHTLKGDLDLEPILVKAMDAKEGYGWTLNFARRVAEEYGRFLVLCFECQQDANHLIMPSRPVDDFWHLHILDTEKYIQDCQRCFGSILHRSDQNALNLQETWLNTVALYRSTFGKPPSDIWPWLSPPKPALASFDHGVESGNSSHGISDCGISGHGVAERKEIAKQWIMKDLDLEPIIAKAVDAEQRNGWTVDFTRRVAEEYRRFLVLCLERQQDKRYLIVPSKQVDTFWHLHILDTRKYIEDCQRCFGSVLHHFPYFGMRGDQDADTLQEAYGQTLVLYWWAFARAAPADIWPGSKAVLEPVQTQFGPPLLSHLGEGGSRFDRTRPGLAGQVSSISPAGEMFSHHKKVGHENDLYGSAGSSGQGIDWDLVGGYLTIILIISFILAVITDFAPLQSFSIIVLFITMTLAVVSRGRGGGAGCGASGGDCGDGGGGCGCGGCGGCGGGGCGG